MGNRNFAKTSFENATENAPQERERDCRRSKPVSMTLKRFKFG